MVVLGQWPYQHTITLDQLRMQAKAAAYYFVDKDMIVPKKDALELQKKGYILDDKYLTIMSEEISNYVLSFEKQDFPPTPTSSITSLIEKNKNPAFEMDINRVKESAAALIVNNRNKEIMVDVGALWNNSLGVWILDAIHLKLLRQKRKEKHAGKVKMIQHGEGLMVEISGDVTPHVKLLKEVGGTYNEEMDVWFVPMSSIHKIYHIISS